MPHATPQVGKPTHLLELISAVIWTATLDGQQLLYVNPAIEQVYGRPATDFYADPGLWLDMVHPADRAVAEQSSRELLAHGHSSATYRIVHPDGTVRWLLDRKYIIAAEAGQPQHLGGMATDITSQKQTELALREQEERLREVLENALVASYKRNLQSGTYDYLSPAFTRVTGYTPVEMMAFTIEEVVDLIHPDDQAEIEPVVARSMTGPAGAAYQVDYRFRHKDGQYRWLRDKFIVVHDEQGRPAAWIGSVSDITKRKQAEADLRESELKFRSIVENSSEAIILTDETGRLVEWNPAAERLSGLARAEVLGTLAWDNQFRALPRERRLPAAYEELKSQALTYFQTGQHPRLNQVQEVEIERPDGSHRVVQTSPFSVKTERGYVLGSIVRDVTEPNRIEQALKESELKFRRVVEKSADAIGLTDESGRLEEWNTAAERLFGLSRTEVTGWLIWEHLFRISTPERQTPAVYTQLKAEWQTYFQTGRHPSLNRVVDLEIQRPDGSRRQIQSARFAVPTERGFLLGAVVRDMTEQKQAEAERERLIGKLQTTLAKVKQLSGLLPICANCKKIRDDQGYWQQVEIYIRDHSEAQFSHGICPECMEGLYPGYGRGKDGAEAQHGAAARHFSEADSCDP